MKNNLDLRTLLLAALIAGLAISCTKTEDLIKGTSVNINTDLLINPLTLQILTNEDGVDIPEELDIEVLGADKDKVFTVFGEKELVANVNPSDPGTAMLPIGIRRVEQISVEDPIAFTLMIKADGFMPIVRSFRIVDQKPRMSNVKLVRMEEEPAGVQMQEAMVDAPSEGTSSSIRFETSMSTQGERVSVEMRPGTQLFEQNGQQVMGEVEAMVAHYDLKVQGVHDLVPTSLFSNDALDKEGNSLGFTAFDPVAIYAMEMKSGDKEVKQFSKPLDITVRVKPNAMNPETGAYIKAGDKIPVWSFNEGLGEWQEETDATIVAGNGGQLYAYFRQSHLSIWLLGGRFPCRPRTEIEIINTQQEEFDPIRYYYVEVYRANDNSILWSSYTRFFNRELIRLFSGSSQDVYFKVYNLPDPCSKQIELYTSPTFKSCGEMLTLDLTEPLNINSSDFAKIHVNVAGTCSSSYNDLVVRPTLPIMYRESGCSVWSPLGWLDSGRGATGALKVGEYYDFRISHRSLDRTILDLQVPTQDTTVVIDSPFYDFLETIDVVYDDDGRTIRFEYTDIQVPDKACDEYIDYLNSRGSSIIR
jgi:hypothetical protein